MELTDIERVALLGIQARDTQIQEQFIRPLIQDRDAVLRSIEARLGLDAGTLGKAHQIDMAAWRVVSVAEQGLEP